MEKNANSILKIAIVGPESTGKSQLAQDLALHFNEPWVPEFAREYMVHLNRNYNLNDITQIAEMQLMAEKEKVVLSKKYLFCDTTLLVNKIWASFVFNEIPKRITALYHPKAYNLHLLCDIDLPWEYDPLREHPNHRQQLFEMYELDLQTSKANFVIISGKGQQRMLKAIQAIEQLL